MKLATFNTYWFQGSAFKGFPPPPPRAEILSGIAELLRKNPCELWCLQEVQSCDAARSLAEGCAARLWLHESGQSPQRREYGGATIGFSADWRFVPVRSTSLDRFAIKAIRVSDRLCIANVHLRSDRFTSSLEAAHARCQELSSIINADPQPDLVLGDFNAQLNDDLWKLLEARGYFDAANRVGQRDTPTTLSVGQGDRIWIRKTLSDRFISAGMFSSTDLAIHKNVPSTEYLSDHLPVWVEIGV